MTSFPLRDDSSAALLDLQARIYQQTLRAGRPVASLLGFVTDPRNLAAAWDRVRGADGSTTPGSDGITCDHVEPQLQAWLGRLAGELTQGRYRPSPVRWVDVPKPNRPGQTRRLGILTVRDRLVQAALKQVLEPVLEPVFVPTSFGFRPGRSVAGALAEATRQLSPAGGNLAFTHAVHLDVADCFDTIDHTLLRSELERHLADRELLALLDRLLEAGGRTVRWLWWRRTVGLVQGGALSPLLCNLALHSLDEALANLGSGTGLLTLRYADDLLLLAADAGLARRGIALASKTLARLRQRLRDPRAAPCSVLQGVSWLGVRIQPRAGAGRTAFGYVVPRDKVEQMLERLTEITTPASDRIDPSAFNLARWLVSINTQLRDWRQAYLFADNAAEVFRALDEHCQQRVGELLRHVLGLNWATIRSRYRARLPRGFTTWEVDGAHLVVLSSLAPECARFLTRRPAWMDRKPAPTPPGTNGTASKSGPRPNDSRFRRK